MKILYFTHALFQDSDLPYISTQKNKIDKFYVFINSLKTDKIRSIVNMNDAPSYPCICKATKLKSYKRLETYIDINKTFILNGVKGRWWHPFHFIVAVLFFIKLIRIRPDLIHIVDYIEGYYKFLYLFKNKLVLTVHDPIPHSSFLNNSDYLKKRDAMFSKYRNFIILNNKQKDIFIDTYNLHNKNVYVNSIGVYNFMEKFQDKSIVPKFNYILFWGQVQDHKGIDILLESMLRVHKNHPSVHLIVAGNGKVNFSIEKYTEKEYIHYYKGYLPMDQIASLIRSSLFVICPYKDATQSGVALTTFALSKPIIATNVGTLGELITENVTGSLVKPNDIESLSNSIINLLDSPVNINKFSENIRRIYLEDGDSSWLKICQKYTNIYINILEKNKNDISAI